MTKCLQQQFETAMSRPAVGGPSEDSSRLDVQLH